MRRNRVGISVASVVLLVGCAASDSAGDASVATTGGAAVTTNADGLPTGPCLGLMKQAAAVDEMQDTVSDFYPALEKCQGLDDWVAASGAVPEALDGVDPVLAAHNACNEGPSDSVTCQEALAADPYAG